MKDKDKAINANISHIRNNGYQPSQKQRGYQPKKEINEGYQPTKSISTQPPNKGSNVQPAKNNK